MIFTEFIENAWNDHATKTSAVIDDLKKCYPSLKNASECAQVIQLLTHIYSDHTFEFREALVELERIKQNSPQDASTIAALGRSVILFKYLQGEEDSLEPLSTSDRCRVLAQAASSFAQNSEIEKSRIAFDLAIPLVNSLDPEDPANRALAVTGNNLAATLEEKLGRSAEESELMIKAAHIGRRFWEVAGTWLEIERAEYRLSQCYLAKGDVINSIKHANLCLTICEKNNAEPLEFFFAYEGLVKIEAKMGQPLRSLPKMEASFNSLSESDKSWCEITLKAVQKRQ